jgi:hypothetical protein
MNDNSFTTDQSNPQESLQPILNHPLAAVVGKLKGEFWEETLAEIQRARQADRDYWQRLIDQQEQQDAS